LKQEILLHEVKQMRQIRLLVILSLAILALVLPAQSFAQVGVGISVHVGPPALPVYAQPVCPGPGYIWTPGYWAWGVAGYYWVPGTWVVAPVGLLWTPGYWGWGGGAYIWHAGYWGPHVGFYGGINYGFGYGGVGFIGGAWNHGVFAYNTAVSNVNTTVIHNTYNKTVVVNNTTVNNVSYNGGTGGTTAAPTAAERAAENEPHTAPMNEQTEHEHAASTNKALLASENHGKPSIAATSKAGQFKGPGVVGAGSAASRNAAFHPANSNEHPESAGNSNKTLASNNTHGNSTGGSNQNPKHNDSKPQPKNKNNNTEHHEGKEHPH
jgi:WXXGXW repeat (2 copies)